MRLNPLTSLSGLLLLAAVAGGTFGCDTGFGKPCKLPKSPAFRAACEQTTGATTPDAGVESEIALASAASCAVKEYAGCETRVCLVYQGSSSFCSESCELDDDCEGSARCRSLTGGTGNPAVDCKTVPGQVEPECYCVRKGDLGNETGAPSASSNVGAGGNNAAEAAGGTAAAGGAAPP